MADYTGKNSSSGAVTKDHEYKKGLVGTTKYVVDKKPKVNPRISSPSETKEEPEPGKTR